MKMTRPAKQVLMLATITIVAGCSSVGDKLERELKAYGMPEREADCLADELTDRLGKQDVKSITRLLQTGRKAGDARPSEVMASLRQLDDPHTVETAVKATLGCAALNRFR